MGFLIIYSIAWLVFYRFCRTSVVRADFIITSMFLLLLVGTFNPFLEYPSHPSFGVLFMLFSVHFSFCFGFISAYHLSKGNALNPSLEREGLALFRFLKLTAIFFSFGTVFSSLASGSLPLVSGFLQLSDARSSHWESAYSLGAVDRFLNAISYFSLLYVIAFPFARKNYGEAWLVFIFVAISVIDFTLQKGGRSIILYGLIGFLAVYVGLHKPKLRVVLSVVLVLVGAFYILGAEFYLARSPNFILAPDLFLRHNCAGASYTDMGERLSSELQALVLSSCYFSSPPYFFDVFLERRGIGELALGGYNLSIIFSDMFVDARSDIAALFAHESFGQNPWSTSARDFFIDFGYLAFLFSLVLGIILGRFSKAYPVDSYAGVVRLGILACFAFMFPFISPLVIRPIIYPIIFLMMYPFVFRLIFTLFGEGRGSSQNFSEKL